MTNKTHKEYERASEMTTLAAFIFLVYLAYMGAHVWFPLFSICMAVLAFVVCLMQWNPK